MAAWLQDSGFSAEEAAIISRATEIDALVHSLTSETCGGEMSEATQSDSSVQELLRSIAPRGMCNPCIGVEMGLIGLALTEEINKLSCDPLSARLRAQCARCRNNKLVWRRAFAAGQS